jgi:UDP-N-acetylmuramoyl-tripeptide--D-alanyl-D-alanine ligase
LHADIGRQVAATGVDELLTVADADAMATAAAATPGWSGRARSVSSTDEASAVLRREVQPADAVLVKASNSLQLWRVAEALLAGAPAGAPA